MVAVLQIENSGWHFSYTIALICVGLVAIGMSIKRKLDEKKIILNERFEKLLTWIFSWIVIVLVISVIVALFNRPKDVGIDDEDIINEEEFFPSDRGH